LADLITYIKAFIVEWSPKLQKLVELVDNDLGFVADTLPAPYGDELKGIANATNIPLGDIVLYNIFYEVFTLCTSIVGVDKNGDTLHARNLDFGLFLGWDLTNDTWIISEKLRPLIANINYTRSGVTQYTTVTFIGYIGIFTGVKPGVLSFSMNERFEADGGYIGLFEWLLNINRKQAWVTLIARDLFEGNYDYDASLKILSTAPIMAPCYYILGGPNQKGAVVTRNRANSEDVWVLGSNNTWYLAETNYDHWKKPLFIDDRITPCNTCMKKLGQDNFSFNGIFNVLSSKPVLNKLTVYSALMNLNSGHVETYVQYCKTPCQPF